MTGQRLDKWLWFARLAKTRSLAARLCQEGSVTLAEGLAPKPNHPVRIGDTITLRQGRLQRHITILALGNRRGPAAEARLLYHERAPPTNLRAIEEEAWSPLLDDG
jgi:ribosome-associated heat shock protein Hsp15